MSPLAQSTPYVVFDTLFMKKMCINAKKTNLQYSSGITPLVAQRIVRSLRMGQNRMEVRLVSGARLLFR